MASQSEIRDKFDVAYNGARNFMTPQVLRYGTAGPYFYELSTGEGFSGEQIWGVTALRLDGSKAHDMCACCHSMDEVEDQIERLRHGND